MRCLHPLVAWKVPAGMVKDKPYAHLSFKFMPGNKRIQIPCGKCITCLINKRLTWTLRCNHEVKMLKDSCAASFITLTYDDEHLPPHLMSEHLTLFIKRLRQYLFRNFKVRIRHFSCGEYGSKSGRPHYHLLIFGWRGYGFEIFLQDLWQYGFVSFSDVNSARIDYVCGYVMKKLHPTAIRGDYPEFIRYSQGLGRDWLDKYWMDVLHQGTIPCNGRQYPVPEYYLKRIEKFGSPEALSRLADYYEMLEHYRADELSDFEEAYFARVFSDKMNRAFIKKQEGSRNEHI